MKRLALAVTVSGVLSACGSTGSNYSAQYSTSNNLQSAQAKSAVEQAPVWMSKLPKAPGYVFENGTATSGDFAFADIKAKTMAYAKICTAAGGKVRSQVKMFKSDNGNASVEQSEMAMRSMCPDVDITGVETVEMKHVADGNRIRTYVLVALPIGSANTMKTTKESARNSKEAFQELDEITGNSKAEPATTPKGQEISVVRPDGSTGTLNLLQVENEEYKARRAEAIKKPGAVVGQVTIN